MAKGYWINCFRAVKDPKKIEAYRNLAGPVMQAAGAKFLVRGDPVKTYEAGLMMRTVVIEFESVAGRDRGARQPRLPGCAQSPGRWRRAGFAYRRGPCLSFRQ